MLPVARFAAENRTSLKTAQFKDHCARSAPCREPVGHYSDGLPVRFVKVQDGCRTRDPISCIATPPRQPESRARFTAFGFSAALALAMP
jgi:hypothetical protein